jgi:hypothetical protein
MWVGLAALFMVKGYCGPDSLLLCTRTPAMYTHQVMNPQTASLGLIHHQQRWCRRPLIVTCLERRNLMMAWSACAGHVLHARHCADSSPVTETGSALSNMSRFMKLMSGPSSHHLAQHLASQMSCTLTYSAPPGVTTGQLLADLRGDHQPRSPNLQRVRLAQWRGEAHILVLAGARMRAFPIDQLGRPRLPGCHLQPEQAASVLAERGAKTRMSAHAARAALSHFTYRVN